MPSVTEICAYLDLTDPLKHSTCIGYGQRRPDCRNTVAHGSRQEATTVLRTIARYWQSAGGVDEELDQLASLLLCKRNHQGQAGEKVHEWKRKLKNAAKRNAEAETSRADRSSLPASSSSPASRSAVSRPESDSKRRRREVRLLPNKDLLKELKRRLFDEAEDELIDRFLELADEVRDVFGNENTSEEESSDDDSDENSDHSGSEEESSDDDSDESSNHSGSENDGESGQPQRQQTPAQRSEQTADGRPALAPEVAQTQDRLSAEGLRQARIAALSTSATSITTPAPPQPPSPLRQSHIECGICLEPYSEEHDDDYWECRLCQNRVCLKCFGECNASIEGDREARCSYCRAEV